MAEVDPGLCPGLANLVKMGAVHAMWDPAVPLAEQLEVLLGDLPDARDQRDVLGKERGGRLQAHGRCGAGS